MNIKDLNARLPRGFRATHWTDPEGREWIYDRIYINYGKYGKAGNYLLFSDGEYQALGFDNSMGETKEIHQAFSEWWEKEKKNEK